MKIGIIGCGYVGHSVAVEWKKEGHYISTTTRRPERVAQLKNFVDSVCLLNEQTFPTYIEQQEVLLICVAPDASSDYVSTYLHTAKQVATQASRAPFLRQIIYTSSTSLYGDHQGEWVDEESPLHFQNENQQILYETEKILLDCSSPNLHVCILRLGEIYGPGREIEERLRRNQNHFFAGSGASFTNLIHLNDIVKALGFVTSAVSRLRGIYNLCSDFHISRKQFYDQICQKEKIPFIQWDPTRSTSHGGNRRVSNQKIKNEGFVFTHPLYEFRSLIKSGIKQEGKSSF